MARGWESKSVEEQIEAAQQRRAQREAAPLSPEQAAIERELDGLRLSRTRVQNELAAATHPRRRESLEEALRFLEDRIRQLESTTH